MKWLSSFLKKCITTVPTGPCKYCGEPSSNENPYQPGLFAHEYCRELAYQKAKAEGERREKIEIVKQAMRELEQEKQQPSNGGTKDE